MKNYFLMLLVGMLFLASCSTGDFAKRKYTKGKYKAEKNDYKVAKNDNKSDDTKYVAKTEKNKFKQNYKQGSTEVEKKETTVKTEKVVVEETKTEVAEKTTTENKTVASNNNVILEDGIANNKTETNVVEENEAVTTVPAEPAPAPASAGEILGYIGFGLGILGLLFVILGAFVSGALFWAGFAFALIALGVSIASWVLDGQSMWNLVGVITSAVALAFAIVWLIIVAII